jgi:sugar phosphate isomerase/epimerase
MSVFWEALSRGLDMLYGAMNFPVRPVLQELEEIATLGFDYVELAMDPLQSHLSSLKRQRKELFNALQNIQMPVVCHLPTFLSIADLTPSIRLAPLREVLESLDVASEFSLLKDDVIHHSGEIRRFSGTPKR